MFLCLVPPTRASNVRCGHMHAISACASHLNMSYPLQYTTLALVSRWLLLPLPFPPPSCAITATRSPNTAPTRIVPRHARRRLLPFATIVRRSPSTRTSTSAARIALLWQRGRRCREIALRKIPRRRRRPQDDPAVTHLPSKQPRIRCWIPFT